MTTSGHFDFLDTWRGSCNHCAINMGHNLPSPWWVHPAKRAASINLHLRCQIIIINRYWLIYYYYSTVTITISEHSKVVLDGFWNQYNSHVFTVPLFFWCDFKLNNLSYLKTRQLAARLQCPGHLWNRLKQYQSWPWGHVAPEQWRVWLIMSSPRLVSQSLVLFLGSSLVMFLKSSCLALAAVLVVIVIPSGWQTPRPVIFREMMTTRFWTCQSTAETPCNELINPIL